jgi:hypothetical protein
MKRNAEIGLFTKSSNDPGSIPMPAQPPGRDTTFRPPLRLLELKNVFPIVAWMQKCLKFAPVRPIDNPKPPAAGTVASRSLGAAMRYVAENTHNLIYYL